MHGKVILKIINHHVNNYSMQLFTVSLDCKSYLCLHKKLPQNVVASNNSYLIVP